MLVQNVVGNRRDGEIVGEMVDVEWTKQVLYFSLGWLMMAAGIEAYFHEKRMSDDGVGAEAYSHEEMSMQ